MNQSPVLCLAALLPVLTASAQDWAKARLEKSPRHLEWVKVKHDQREVNCFVAYPEVQDKATAVVLIHEIFGLTDWVREVADRLPTTSSGKSLTKRTGPVRRYAFRP